jgi:hypothetical protein
MKKISHTFLLMLLIVGFLFLVACEKTKLDYSWADPDAAKYRFTKPLVVAVLDNDELRSVAEEAIVRNIKSVQAYPSYMVLREGEAEDVEAAKKRLLAAGYDGAVILRLVNLEDKVNYTSATYPSYYHHYWGYYNWAWNTAMYSPVYIQKERIVQLETSLFSITDDKLLWMGVSTSKNPASVSSLIDEIAEVIGKELRKKGIVR